MNRFVISGASPSIEQAAAELARRLADPPVARAGSVRWEIEVPDTDPLAWLNHHDNLVRMYCSNRDRRLQIAALGVADMLRYKDGETDLRDALADVFGRLEELPEGMRIYGGMRFYPDPVAGDISWQRFGQVRFVLPAVELIRDDHRTVLAANLVDGPEVARTRAMLAVMLAAMRTPPRLSAAHLPMPVKRVNQPDRAGWERMIQTARNSMANAALEKVVLSRRCTFDFEESLHPMALLQRLHEATPDCFHFCFNYGNEIAFIGATPERLYHRTGRHWSSEALAGTRPRGATEEDDRWLESDLLASGKERREHQLVVDAIAKAIGTFAVSVLRDEAPEVLKLRYVQHLRTTISAELREGVSDADLLLAMHPTPAVGGWPRDAALRSIQQLEPFDRGWYAAPIGWIMKGETEFAVAIRCALVEGRQLSLYSGAGIMPDSEPEQEWREIESKIGNFLRILTS